MHILIVEDDFDMQKILRLYLQKEGFTVSIVSNGRDAIEFLSENHVHLVIMDWMMPIEDGIQTCKEIRFLHIPTKLFNIQILLLRIRKLCHAENILSFQDIRLNPDTMEVTKEGEKIILTKTEYELLKFFLSNQNQILSREVLLNHMKHTTIFFSTFLLSVLLSGCSSEQETEPIIQSEPEIMMNPKEKSLVSTETDIEDNSRHMIYTPSLEEAHK
ncbi:MAG: response regulator transcription factor [Hungatella sp.]|nr:response regulator transcription factor [Hungatella sp.]